MSIETLVNELFTKVNIDTFSGSTILLKYPNFTKPSSVEELLKFMDSHGGTRQGEFPKSEDKENPFVGEYIEERIDFTSDFWWTQVHKDSDKNKFWNESVEKLNQEILKFYNHNVVNSYYIVKDWISVYDIVRADAGASFETKSTEWVRPFKTLYDNTEPNGPKYRTYKEVRGYDKIRDVLGNEHHLQFTREEKSVRNYSTYINQYLRLLMPMYKRLVEVEDLNRNFWVIGQVIGGICEFLFMPESPLKKFFKSIIDEVTQLWENVLYLWVLAQHLAGKELITDLKVIQIPITNSNQYDWIKFDDFNRTAPTWTDSNEIMNRLQYLIDMYQHTNLIVIPEIRQKGYFKNHYAEVIFPGVMVWNANIQRKFWSRFQRGEDRNAPVIIDLTDQKLGWNNTAENELKYKVSSDKFYYVRPKVFVDAHVQKEKGSNNQSGSFSSNHPGAICIKKITIDCSDNDAFDKKFYIKSTESERKYYSTYASYGYNFSLEVEKETVEETEGAAEQTVEEFIGESQEVVKPVYYGEVVSWKKVVTLDTNIIIDTWKNIMYAKAGSDGGDGDQKITSAEQFLKYLNSETGIKQWELLLQEDEDDALVLTGNTIKDQPIGSIYIYCCHANLYNGREATTALLEVNPYLTFVYKKTEKDIFIKTYILRVKKLQSFDYDGTKLKREYIHQEIPFPYVSSVITGISSNSTAMLGRIYRMEKGENGNWLTSKNENKKTTTTYLTPAGHQIITAKTEQTAVVVVSKNLDSKDNDKPDEPVVVPAMSSDTFRNNSEQELKTFLENSAKLENGNKDPIQSGSASVGNLYFGSMSMSYAGRKLSVNNFYIYCTDRAYAAANTIKDIVPYFYYCSKDSYDENVINCTYNIMRNYIGGWKTKESHTKNGYGTGKYNFWRDYEGEEDFKKYLSTDKKEGDENGTFPLALKNDLVRQDFEQFLDNELAKESPSSTRFRDMAFIVDLKEVTNSDGDTS